MTRGFRGVRARGGRRYGAGAGGPGGTREVRGVREAGVSLMGRRKACMPHTPTALKKACHRDIKRGLD